MMSAIAFLFPGQGAQHVGMGKDFADASPAAKRTYEEAADTLGWNVARVCFHGPPEELDRTEICQPAILTTSLAILAAMEEAGRAEVNACAAAAGLSLGEYSALVMARAMTFPDALRLVRKRGRFMEDACRENPGAMTSILGLEDGIVEAICAETRQTDMVVAANYNCPGQVVISGTRQGVEKAAALALQRGAKRALPLAVSGAFHSPLMEPAAARLEAELAQTPISPCQITVLSNVGAEPVKDPPQIRNALARQLRCPVRWTQSVRRLVREDHDTFIELGPGKVLTALFRRIAPGAAIENISHLQALQAKVAH